MKKNRLPTEIDPRALASKRASLEGSYGLEDFPRIQALVHNPDFLARFHLNFELDEEGRALVLGEIQANLDLPCQRCGEPVRYDLKIVTRLAAVLNENQARELPEPYEPLVTQGLAVSLAVVVEDEVLLAIPMIPKHKSGACPVDLPKCLQ